MDSSRKMSPKFILIITAVIFCAVGCKSTPSVGSKVNGSNSASETVITTPESKKSRADKIEKKPAKLRFVQETHLPTTLESIKKQFDTISLVRFKLQQHSLYKTELTNDILFEIDSSNSYNIMSSDIRAIAKLFNTEELGQNLYVVGHTDSRGGESYNLRLSLRRAMNVATKLANEGIDVDRIKLVPAGEYQPIALNQPGTYRKNRRVDILSADSKALISAYIREQDCTSIDTACKRSELSVLSLEKDPLLGVVMKTDRYDTVTVAAPSVNDLNQLSRDLAVMGSNAVDEREKVINEKERLGPSTTETRDTFKMDVLIREPLVFKKIIRDVLKFDAKYIID